MPNFSYTAKNWHLHICISCINICHLREVQGKLFIAWFEYRKVRFQFRSIFTLNTRCISCQKRTIKLIQGRKYQVLTRMYYLYVPLCSRRTLCCRLFCLASGRTLDIVRPSRHKSSHPDTRCCLGTCHPIWMSSPGHSRGPGWVNRFCQASRYKGSGHADM